LAIELLLVLPLLLGILLAMIEFSLILSARQQVTVAAREGVRVAALGGSEDDVRNLLGRVLGDRNWQFDVTMMDGNGAPLEPGDPMEIVVNVPTRDFVPDLLRFLGFSVQNTTITSRAVMLKE
jgi:hypothetical protein